MLDCYELACTDCQFRTAVLGDYETALDEGKAHRRTQQAGPGDHFVNVRRLR